MEKDSRPGIGDHASCSFASLWDGCGRNRVSATSRFKRPDSTKPGTDHAGVVAVCGARISVVRWGIW
jgi:hypothetical protein